jgi:CBS domain containing-hemolysin-like protein
MNDSDSSSIQPRDSLWKRLKSRLGRNGDSTLRESIEDVIESHGKDNGGEPIKAEARSMMLNLLAFAELRVDDVMVPRADIIAVPETASMRELLDRFTEANHSRIPVYRETLDDTSGMVHIKDVVRWMSVKGTKKRKKPAKDRDAKDSREKEKEEVRTAALSLSAVDFATSVKQAGVMRELLFVPPSMPASDLLMKMQATHIHMAIVVDEYGGTDGLVSIEDLVEEIVGDIADEHDTDEAQMIRETEPGIYLADARVDIETLEQLLGIDFLPDERDEDADTLGGLVFSMMGRVPARGEVIRHDSGVEFEIVDSDPRRVKRIRIHAKAAPEARDVDPSPSSDEDGNTP